MQEQFYSVGFYALINGVTKQMTKFDIDQIEKKEILDVKPIRLTSEWLRKLGFTQRTANWYLNHSDTERVEIVMHENDVLKIEFMFDDEYTFFDSNIEYVHILQFLYKNRYGKTLKEI